MEKLLMKMEVDPDVYMDWYSYIVTANGYLRASWCGKKNEVYRIWDLHKKTGKVYNMSYLSMISALAKLDNLDGAEKIWEEWQAKKEHFDFRVPNLVIKAYCKKSLLGKAKSIVNRLVESGKEPSGSIWQHLASGLSGRSSDGEGGGDYEESHLGESPRVEAKPCHSGCMFGIFERELLREKGSIPKEACDRLVNYMESGDPTSKALDIMVGKNQAPERERGMEI
ncbi:pentatricopeptide repeat-containing protein At2g20710, mitochondrial-like [Actinidia eriantha]|uniref:pentatricopeptide repeat-containing protein At2g20710, mitochondrial-like n=1 Tax=Actinidia eriantha TaxID=165200 RepID=UPI00258710BA|nr:pentatricopeptide repeat-containing protein At2g20710, mitochondrial-like [Actinidia eriantha]